MTAVVLLVGAWVAGCHAHARGRRWGWALVWAVTLGAWGWLGSRVLGGR